MKERIAKNWKSTLAGLALGTVALAAGDCRVLLGYIPPEALEVAAKAAGIGTIVLGASAYDRKQ